MCILGLTLTGLASLDHFLRSRSRFLDSESKHDTEDGESKVTDAQETDSQETDSQETKSHFST